MKKAGVLCTIHSPEGRESQLSQADTIICPKCGTEQERTVTCVHCGNVFEPEQESSISQAKPVFSKKKIQAIGAFVSILVVIIIAFFFFNLPEQTPKTKGVEKIVAKSFRMTTEELKKATVYVKGNSSGFLIHKTPNSAFIITNAYVVKEDNNETTTVTFNHGEPNELALSAKVFAVNRSNALAILQASWAEGLPNPIKISSQPIEEAQEVRIFGGPTISKGMISKNDQMLEIYGDINQENSAGPIVTSEGVFVGVATIDQTGGGVVVPAHEIKRMMGGILTEIAAIKIEKLSSDSNNELGITLQAKKIDLFNQIKEASFVLVPENPSLLKFARQSDGSWQNIAEDKDFEVPMRVKEQDKMVVKIILSQAPLTVQSYYGQIIITTTDEKIIYQPPFQLKINLKKANQPIEMVGSDVLKDVSNIFLRIENAEMVTSASIEDVILAGGGQYLIVKFQQPHFAVFDVASGEWVKKIQMTSSYFEIAANQNKLLIGIRGTNRLQRWDLETLAHETTVKLEGNIKIKSMALGWASQDAPLLILTSKGDKLSEQLVFVDVDTLTPMPVDWSKSQRNQWHIKKDIREFIRASANGKLFTGWYASRPEGYIIQLKDNMVDYLVKETRTGYLAASPDGETIYTLKKGIFNALFQSKGANLEERHLMPGTKGQFFLEVNYQRERSYHFSGKITIYRARDYRPLLILEKDSEMMLQGDNDRYFYKQPLTEEKRYFFFPDLDRLITVPFSNDRIKIQEVRIGE